MRGAAQAPLLSIPPSRLTPCHLPLKKGRHYGRLLAGQLLTIMPLIKRLPCERGRTKRALCAEQREVSPSKPRRGEGERTRPKGVRSPGIPGQRSAGRYEDPSETGNIASALCERRRPEGLEWRAHGAKHSAQPRNTGQAKRSAVRTQRGDHVELWNGGTA